MQAAMHSMSKVVQERVSPTHNVAMSQHCDAPINAMALNKDLSQVVVAGRQVFKILAIEDDRFTEISNLRVGKHKNINLNYSAADVAWNHHDEHMLASAATNGAVVIWNLSKLVKSKQDFVFMEHKRSVNRVVFHSSESHQLLSGSQDGAMMLHDMRRKQVSLIFRGQGSESVRDIQFCPPNLGYFNFAAAYENGLVQIWDMRRPDRCEKHFTAHNEPVFSLDWHPEDKYWLATASRDKMIKVWDTNRQPAQLLYCVQTIASVGRIKWRPQRRYHIANCSLLLDHSVNVWDVRRPYIPFASFDQHKDVATCVVWKDPHVMLSTGKDCMLHQNIFAHAQRPADHVIPCGVDISPLGHISLAVREKNAVHKSKESSGKTSIFNRKSTLSRSELFFTQATSAMTIFQQITEPSELEQSHPAQVLGSIQLASEDISMMGFLQLARQYRLKGQTTQELCKHNSTVAASVNKQLVAHTWLMLADIFCIKTPITKASTLQAARVNVTPTSLIDRQDVVDKGLSNSSGKSSNSANRAVNSTSRATTSANKTVNSTSKSVSSPDNELDTPRSDIDHREKNGDNSTGTSEDSDEESSEYEKNLANIASGLGHNGDFFFGDGDTEVLSSYSLGINMRGGEDWTHLPSEAFQPRHEITGPTAPPDRPDHDSMLVAAVESDSMTLMTPVDESEPREQQYLNLNIESLALQGVPTLDFTTFVAESIISFAEQGDVQSSVSMIIVLGDPVRSHLDIERQEDWFLSYVDLLSRFELWTIANEVISLSQLPPVSQLNQISTTIHTSCPQCARPMERSGWLCDRCKNVVNLCSICHLPAKGVFVWCQGCCHGGHLQHIREWFETNTLCPAGCSHHCQYT